MKYLIIVFFLISNSLFSQQQDSLLVKEVLSLRNNVLQQKNEIIDITKKVNRQNHTINLQKRSILDLNEKNINLITLIDSLEQLVQANSQNIVVNSQELGTKIQETGQKTGSQIAALDKSIEKNRLYWIIATLAIFLLGGLIYWLLGKRILSNKTDVETQIRNTKTSLEEESVRLDNKLVEVLERQLKLQKENTNLHNIVSNEKTDHSLALKVADEIIRIQKNLSRMNAKTKGLKQLNSSVKRIQDNFAANGYELVDMLGKEYNEGMKVSANFIPSEELETGKQIITRIIKPQVNYKGSMIQAAQIEVSVGE